MNHEIIDPSVPPFRVGDMVRNVAKRNCHGLAVGVIGECVEIGPFDSEFGMGWSCTIRVDGQSLERASTYGWRVARAS